MRLRGWNYEPFFCSVGTKEGLDAIAFVLRNQTSVIVGPSGVGKSSLINILRSSSGGGDVEDENWFEPVRFCLCLSELCFTIFSWLELGYIYFR